MKRFLSLILLFPTLLFAQKKTLDHSAYDEWRDFKSRMISNDGKYVAYSLANNNVGNEEAILKTHGGDLVMTHDRSSGLKFTNDSKYLVFKVSPNFFEMRDMKRRKKTFLAIR